MSYGQIYYTKNREKILKWQRDAYLKKTHSGNHICVDCGCEFHGRKKKRCKDCEHKEYLRLLSLQREKRKIEKKCPECGITFIAPNKKFCSIQCLSISTKKRLGVKLLVAEERKCAECGTAYMPDKHNHLHCSEMCRRRAYDRRTLQNRRERQKRKRDTNPVFRLNKSMSSLLWRALKENKKSQSWTNLVGYDIQRLVKHLEKQFYGGMSWDNYGKWHVDHILPRSRFNFTKHTDPDFKKCWGLKNLQPLWAIDNMSKGDRINIKLNN